MLVLESVQFCLQLHRFFIFDNLRVSLVDLLYLEETAVREAVPREPNLYETHVFVQSLEELRLDLLTEKVVCQFNLVYLLVLAESVDQRDQTEVCESTGRKV